jgi:hypothetical protein
MRIFSLIFLGALVVVFFLCRCSMPQMPRAILGKIDVLKGEIEALEREAREEIPGQI